MKLPLAFLAIIFVAPLAANADYIDDGGELPRILKSDNVSEISTARGYVAGVQDFVNGENNLCVPPVVKMSQAAAITQKWLENHPERWHEKTSYLVFLALQEAFARKESEA